MNKVADAWETLDVAKAAPYYSKDDDALFFDATPLKYSGWEDYASGWKEVSKDWSALSLTMNDDAWIEIEDDVAATAVTGRAQITTKAGEKMSFDVRWSAFWEKKGKDWIILHDHFSIPWVEPSMEHGTGQ
jgi:ketosteroid isomerase-like protein